MESRTNFDPANWPPGNLTRVPFPLYSDPAIYQREQEALFRGPIWHYLGLEAEAPNPGDWLTTQLGDAPIVLARALDGSLNAFENRCAHRGALLCLAPSGNSKTLTCVYHAWGYDLKGNLTGVAFRRGIQGKGGMPPDFDMKAHGLRKLRVASIAGIVFATYCAAAPPLEDYLGPEIASRIRRVMKGPPKVLGYYTQTLPNNWKLYIENVKDSYHASLLHLFFTTFELNRLSQPGGIIVDESGGHHVSYSMIEAETRETEYAGAGLRSDRQGYRLADPSMLLGKDEFGDGITLQILTVFPTFVLQQIQNCLALRRIVPTRTGETALHWTYFGFADDDAEMDLLRLKQANLVGPGGYISMEDGAVGGFVQRAIAGAPDDASIVMMGGDDASSQDTRATESSVRGFWKAYRALMGL
jgi:phenylpropionate dioxygenase-like ring-hydroxylating dioxygenase large terminal subunit